MKRLLLKILLLTTIIINGSCKNDKELGQSCLDKGGSWNYKLNKCIYENKLPNSNRIIKENEEVHKLELVYRKVIKSSSEEDINNFIELFPNSFIEMKELFGYNDDKGATILYEKGYNIIKFFSELKPKEHETYYNKYINICVNGRWEADNIREGFGIHNRLINDYENICPILNQRNDDELKSVFKFIFDGPHPDNKFNNRINSKIQELLPSKYERIKKLVNFAYQDLLIKSKH